MSNLFTNRVRRSGRERLQEPLDLPRERVLVVADHVESEERLCGVRTRLLDRVRAGALVGVVQEPCLGGRDQESDGATSAGHVRLDLVDDWIVVDHAALHDRDQPRLRQVGRQYDELGRNMTTINLARTAPGGATTG